MGIASDWARIKGNINAALTAIADKGVTVPSGSTSDALAELIASIEAGGGGSASVFSKVNTGTITPTADAQLYLNIQHSLGQLPDVVIVYPEYVFEGSYQPKMYAAIYIGDGGTYFCVGVKSANYWAYRGTLSGATSKDIEFCGYLQINGKIVDAYFVKATSYRWIAGVYA